MELDFVGNFTFKFIIESVCILENLLRSQFQVDLYCAKIEAKSNVKKGSGHVRRIIGEADYDFNGDIDYKLPIDIYPFLYVWSASEHQPN